MLQCNRIECIGCKISLFKSALKEIKIVMLAGVFHCIYVRLDTKYFPTQRLHPAEESACAAANVQEISILRIFKKANTQGHLQLQRPYQPNNFTEVASPPNSMNICIIVFALQDAIFDVFPNRIWYIDGNFVGPSI